MRIALAQINPTVGDVRGNAELIRAGIERARQAGARVVVFPELALLGYPPRDLLLKAGMVDANLAALETLAPATGGPQPVAAMVGYVDRNDSAVGRPLYNALALLDGGAVVARKHKTLLPTYDVFDETRYFEPGPSAVVVEVDGLRLGLSICEDIWNSDDPEQRKRYPTDPIAAIAALRPQAIVNISASPYIMGKYETRLAMLRRQAAAHGLPVLYCNQVGGNDELLFDGASLALSASGELVAQCCDFVEAMTLVDLAPSGHLSAHDAASVEPACHVRAGVPSLHAALVMGLADYFRKCGFRDAVLGLSGGIDSAVVACLAAEALGPEHVTAISMPSRYTADASKSDAQLIAEALGVKYVEIPIEHLHATFEETLGPAFADTEPDITEENIQARIRGVLVMAMSNKFGSLALATGNKSELAAGYCTLYGDMCGGIAPIGDVPKGLVYQLARYINHDREIIPERVITRAPTAELKPDQTDQDVLPPYDVVDRVVQLYVEDLEPLEEIVASGVPEAVARDLVRRIDLAEYKRRQAAPTLKVTGRAFGMGRRMPIAQRWREDGRDEK